MDNKNNDSLHDKLAHFLTENMGELRDVVGLTDNEMEALYAEAYDYYAAGQYQEALPKFAVLTQTSHLEKRFHIGYAATLQALGLYMDAARVYLLASTLDLADPDPTARIGYCLMQLKYYSEAKKTLELVLTETALKEEYQALRTQTQAWIDEIGRLEFTDHS